MDRTRMLIEDSGAGARTLAKTVVKAHCQCVRRPAGEGRPGGKWAWVGGGLAGWSIVLHEEAQEVGELRAYAAVNVA
jgi:hypothetical protein